MATTIAVDSFEEARGRAGEERSKRPSAVMSTVDMGSAGGGAGSSAPSMSGVEGACSGAGVAMGASPLGVNITAEAAKGDAHERTEAAVQKRGGGVHVKSSQVISI